MVSSSAGVDSGARSASCGVAQDEAAAFLAQGCPFLVFTLVESTVNRHGAADSRLCFGTQEDEELKKEAMAALNQQPWRKQQPEKKGNKMGKQGGKICNRPEKFGDQAWKCADPGRCTWPGNE